MIFQDRQDAGQKLVPLLKAYAGSSDSIILGLPRGGVVTAFEVAEGLKLPLDIIVTRKIGAPGNDEFAIGAIDEDGHGVFDQETIRALAIPQSYIDATIAEEKHEAARRLKTYRGNRPPLDLKAKTAILVDDGVATGATMRAAILSAREKGAKKVVVAVPTIAADTLPVLKKECDELVYLDAPQWFGSVGAFYETFAQTEDGEVIELMKKNS